MAATRQPEPAARVRPRLGGGVEADWALIALGRQRGLLAAPQGTHARRGDLQAIRAPCHLYLLAIVVIFAAPAVGSLTAGSGIFNVVVIVVVIDLLVIVAVVVAQRGAPLHLELVSLIVHMLVAIRVAGLDFPPPVIQLPSA